MIRGDSHKNPVTVHGVMGYWSSGVLGDERVCKSMQESVNRHKIPNKSHNERGAVLVMVLMFTAILFVLGTGAYLTSSNELKISNNYKIRKQAFYDAEAGLQYSIAKIEDGLAQGTLSLTGNTVSVNYAAPAGFSFDTITILTRVGTTSQYRFQVTGHSGNAGSTVEAVIAKDTFFQYGVFGGNRVEIESGGSVYSYDSRITPNPAPTDSTGEGDVGSNGQVTVDNYGYVDGDVALGDDGGGTEGIYDPHGNPGPTITGQEGVDVDRVGPDPLGAVGGTLATDFATYGDSPNNDNAGASPAIAGNSIDLGNGQTVTLAGKAGGANYNLTSLTLSSGATLNIDASSGPVNIYLTGALDAKNGSAINITGQPTDVTIYSNSTDDIIFEHGGEMKGAIYAPYAKVEMKNSADVYGMIWAKDVLIHNPGVFYFDTALKDQFASNEVSLVSWREVRN